MTSNKIKVIYIAGCSFSGTTLFSNIIGQVDNFFSAGEVRCLWNESILKNYKCGCGLPFKDCQTWHGILKEAFPDRYNNIDVLANEMVLLRENRLDLPKFLIPWDRQKFRLEHELYLSNLDKLYTAISRFTNSTYIVDSSKSPLYAYVLSLLPSIELHVIHLFRHPVAVQHSCLKRKQRGDKAWKNYNVFSGSLTWYFSNLASEVLCNKEQPGSYMRVGFEEFIDSPENTLSDVLKMVGAKADELPLSKSKLISIPVNHTVIGNRNRFEKGPIVLKKDEQWRQEMSAVDKWLVSLLTAPLHAKYRFSSQST
jgi:hypothetical protein